MKMTNKEYAEYVKSKAPGSKLPRNMSLAWLVGGGICVLGQVLLKIYRTVGLDEKIASAAVPVTLVFLSAVMTGLHIYDNVAKWAGAGTLVPITGFSNAMVSPAMEFKSEGLVAGLAAKMFSIAGPVIVFGVIASVIYGLLLKIFGIA